MLPQGETRAEWSLPCTTEAHSTCLDGLTAYHAANGQTGQDSLSASSILFLPLRLLLASPKCPSTGHPVPWSSGRQVAGLPASPPNKPCGCQAVGANANNDPSVTVSFQEGGGLSGRRSGEGPGCWVRAREKEPVVTALVSPTAAEGIE